jgi:hypothetical protein
LFDLQNAQPIKIVPQVRDTLFGDMQLSQWPGPQNSADSEPWASFRRAQQSVNSGDLQTATEVLLRILDMPNLESRQYLQAWHFLRNLGVNPPNEKGKQLLGVVVEVGMEKGVDLVAAYADHSARYYNFSGAGVVWDSPNNSLDGAIDNLLQAGAVTIQAIGPWKNKRPPAPSRGNVRINLLSPSGLHFGQGPFETLSKDPLGAPVIAAALRLMQTLMSLAKK